MKILPFQDNALFLQNWRERMRFSSVVSAVILTTIILFLILLSSTINSQSQSDWNEVTHRWSSKPIPWTKVAFQSIAYFQGVILLFFGTLAADKMALREKSSGTLEFHRASPTNRIDQFLGLLFGAPSLEWCLFAGTWLVSLVLLPFSGIPNLVFLKFYLGLILCAVFYHTLAILLAMVANRKGILSQRRFSAVHLLAVLFFLSGLFIYELGLSCIYHVTWFPVFEQISPAPTYDEQYYSNLAHNLYSLFGWRLPSLIIQILTQVPLIILFTIGIIRKISKPEQPVFSKPQSAFLSLWVLLLFVGSSYSILLSGGNWHYEYRVDSLIGLFIFLVMGLTVIGTMNATPAKLQFFKGILKAKKLGLDRENLNDDQSGNLLWLITYCMIVAAIYFVLSFAMPVGWLEKSLCLVILLCYVIFFASAYEYFQLSPHHKRIAFFWTGIIILWVILPVLAMILRVKEGNEGFYYTLVGPSPFWSTELIINTLSAKMSLPYGVCGVSSHKAINPQTKIIDYGFLVIVLSINMLLALLARSMARRVTRDCRREALNQAG